MSSITLGSISFQGFEIPAQVAFGGAQKLSVHTLIGGTRVIDAMGRDDAALTWSGVLSGSSASARARLLDAMRASGNVQTLTWDVFSYSVILRRLRLEFRNPWWIPYTLECEVQRDLAQGVALYSATTVTVMANDLAVAASFLEPKLSAEMTNISNTLATASTENAMQIETSLLTARSMVEQSLASSGAQLSLDDLGMLTNAAGSVAQLCCARSYICRSIFNAGELVA